MNSKNLPLTRRGFLGVTAALATPMIIPSHVLGGPNKPSANEKINIGLIGIGKQMHDTHLPHFITMPEVKVVAVCDVDTTRRTAAKKRVDEQYHNTDCAAYVDYHQIIDRKDIDAIVCATPDHWHTNIILNAIHAGKDIYCEKPLTNTLAEAKRVMDAANSSKIIFQVGSQQRSDNEFRYACELVRNHRIGKIKQVMVGIGGPPKHCNLPGEKIEPGLDWDRWLGPAPLREYSSILSPRGVHDHFPSWRAFREYGGGAVTDWGAHHIDIAQWGLNMDKSGPIEIIPPKNFKAGRGMKLLYANGVEVIHGGPDGITFIGEKGEIFVNRGQLTSKPDNIIKQPIGKSEIHLYKSPSGAWYGHHQDWVNCIRSRKKPNTPAETGARTIAVCHLINIAYLHGEALAGKSLKWDPKKWEFVDNDEANTWQDYSYARREGYELPDA
jgi:predicted dehydrogenase